jgi:Xaa-Pro aminopeptidase
MSNLQRLQARLRDQDIPALLVSDIVNVQWLTGFTGSFGVALVTASDGVFISDSRYTLQAQEEVSALPSKTFASPTDGATFIGESARELGIQRLGFESQTVTYDTYLSWKEKMKDVELFPTKDTIAPLRMIKTADEVEKIRAACKLADACFDHVLRLMQPGVSEYDIALEIEFFFRRNGAGLAFDPIVVSGERSARPHGKPSEKKLEAGDFVTMDFGARLDGYNSDLTRTVVIGKPTDRHHEVYGQVLKAQLAALSAMKPGVPAKEVDGVSRRVLDELGLAQYFGHGLGHGLGKVTHDNGRLNPTSDNVLEEGQVWTVEPGVYIEGFGGVRIEDDVVVTRDGIEILTSSTKELLSLPQA